jgi:hypothetical protein
MKRFMIVSAWVGLGLVLTGLLFLPSATFADKPLPIVFVHGRGASAALFETQALRWASNEYPNLVTGIDLTSAAPEQLDAFFDAVKVQTGDDQVHVVAHSAGALLMAAYLNNSPARSARVAKYINIDAPFFQGNACPGNPSPVECLNISKPGVSLGNNNVHFADQSHNEMLTSEESFIAQYKFLAGKEPSTTLVLPQPPGQVQIAGRALNFPENTGVDQAGLQIWEVSCESGARKSPAPDHAHVLGPDGNFGPFQINGQKCYEFAVSRPDTNRVFHYYQQPFIRSNYLIRLISSSQAPTFIGPNHSAAIITRYKEWWTDQAGLNDTLWVSTQSPLFVNDVSYPSAQNVLSDRKIGFRMAEKCSIFLHDDEEDRISSLELIPGFTGRMTGVDIWMPAVEPPDGTISFMNEPRGDATKPQIINVPNWASEGHSIRIRFNDYAQDINSWDGCMRINPSPCK